MATANAAPHFDVDKENVRMRLPFPFLLLFFVAALLLSITSCKRKGKPGSAGISKTELKQLNQAQAEAEKMVATLEQHFAEDRFSFSPISPAPQENLISSLIEGPSHVICETEDGRSLTLEERKRIKIALRELGFEEIGLLEIKHESEEAAGQSATAK